MTMSKSILENALTVQIWARGLKNEGSWLVRSKKGGFDSKRSISQFLAAYLIEQSAKTLPTINNIGDKMEELELIKEVDEENALEATLGDVTYFIKYANFEF